MFKLLADPLALLAIDQITTRNTDDEPDPTHYQTINVASWSIATSMREDLSRRSKLLNPLGPVLESA